MLFSGSYRLMLVRPWLRVRSRCSVPTWTATSPWATLAAELQQLTRAVTDWHSPPPATPDRPHNQRMPEIAVTR